MATSRISEVIEHLRRTVLPPDGAGLTDGQLLEDFLSRRDEAALAFLVRRHGPMVWGVCRRVLLNYHDAEDAFQATFLVLVRKAASIASKGSVGNWLYGVAHQTALKARATTAKRRARERQVTAMPEPAVVEQDLWRDLGPLLDEELSRLPDRYRAVIVLCDLEGKTRKQAARQLDCPEGTVAGRLARARRMLAKRLTQRGVALSGGALAAVLSQKAASASVPASVVSATIKAAGLLTAGGMAAGAIPVNVATLTEGVMKAMRMSKLRTALAVLLILACVGKAALTLLPAAAGQPPTVTEEQANPSRLVPATAGAPRSKADKEEVKKLQGVWEVVSFVQFGGASWSNLEGEVIVFNGDQIRGMVPAGEFTLDRSRKPSQITVTYKKPREIRITTKKSIEEKQFNAVYELRGDDLKIAYSNSVPPVLPKELKSTSDNSTTLIVLKRLKLDSSDGK
jgi:RNA polymerase sigma factor (sigma-70 family)